MRPELKSRLKIQTIILLVLFLLVEIILRLFGMQAGVLIDDFKIQENPVYQPRFNSDSLGINHIMQKKEMLMLGSVINNQGFRGAFDYTPATLDSIRKNTKEEIIMIIGDSYVEGCCPDNVANSFPDLLHKDSKYVVLNFGVAGTDPLQYKLVAQKYIPYLKPDRVVTAVYFGNDITFFDRKPTPGTPLTFPFKDNKWLFQIAPNHLKNENNYSFLTADEAYNFYIEKYTLKGKNRNVFEKTISYSVIFSKLYLYAEHKSAQRRWQKNNPNLHIDGNLIVYKNLKAIQMVSDSMNIPCVFVGIPAPNEANEGMQLKTKYKDVFKDIPWFVPDNLSTDDYDGKDVSNHFNNKGHFKYVNFLKSVLEKTKTSSPKTTGN